jgi:hypothetical protein
MSHGSFEYEENSVTGVGGGQIIAIGTDGIWEAHNNHGEMFGKARFRDALRRLAETEVEGIIEAIFEELKEFTTGVSPKTTLPWLSCESRMKTPEVKGGFHE